MEIITDRCFRNNLAKRDVRVVNDLTQNQTSIVAEAKKEGKVAYFRKGKLVVGPRPDPRTYAEAAAADNKMDMPEVKSACA